jgi:RNA-directed DNA polymerase
MLRIQKIEHLARHLGTTSDRLVEVAENTSLYCQELELVLPARPDKRPRTVLNVRGDLRRLQANLLKNVLRPKYEPSEFSHGGVRGRNIKTNVCVHEKSVFVFTTDIANFYPSISHKRVNNLFLRGFGCSPAVARVCTQLCTYRYHLALGLITSPVLADCILKPVDTRIANMCRQGEIIYTRFVDDIILSGKYPIKSGSYPALVAEILRSHGFKVNPDKHKKGLEGAGRFDEGKCVTKLEIRRGRIRVRQEYIDEVTEQLADGARLAAGHEVQGRCYMLPEQIRGRIHYIAWINKGQAAPLLKRYLAQEAVIHSPSWGSDLYLTPARPTPARPPGNTRTRSADA